MTEATRNTTLTLAALPLGPAFTARPACTGRAPLFDAHIDGETDEQRDTRHARAVEICGNCPARPECETEIAAGGRYRGVWAGAVLSTQ